MNNPLFSKEYCGDYFSDGEHLKPQFVDLWADELGQLFGQENLNKSQMRAFFNEAKRLQAIYHVKNDFDVVCTKLLGMKAQAHLRRRRKNGIPEQFRKFIEINVDKVTNDPKNPKKFEAFVQHFEAVAAYCEGRLRKG